MDGIIYGYDPGGDGKHGLAEIKVKDSKPLNLTTRSLDNAHTILRHIHEGPPPLGLGVDTLAAWSTGRCGWRPADRWLRDKYRSCRISVKAPNGLRGSMALNGMAVIQALRDRWPNLIVSETHPKVLYYALTGNLYRTVSLAERISQIGRWLDLVDVKINSDDEWDAAVSAYAALQGITKAWAIDLHKLPSTADESIIMPGGKVSYFWPSVTPSSHSSAPTPQRP